MLTLTNSEPKRYSVALSPGLMAEAVSRGSWRMARHLELLDREIADLILGRTQEDVLAIRMPPRHGKSELVSHYTTAWFMANFPHLNVLLATYSADFASMWGRKARGTFLEAADQYPGYVLGRPDPDNFSANMWATTDKGYMAVAGVGGPLTGRGGHLLITDDLIKNAEEAQSQTMRDKTWEWFTSTWWSRLEPGGKMICIATPWHRDDYMARLRTWDRPVREITLPALAHEDDPLGREPGEALWPDRFDESKLQQIRRDQGEYYWSALYDQNPTTSDRAEWPGEYFNDAIFFDDDELPIDVDCRVIAVDSSKGQTDKSDYTALVIVWHDPRDIFWVDAVIERYDCTTIADKAAMLCVDHNPAGIGFEVNQFQELIAHDYNRIARQLQIDTPLFGLNNSINKIVRIRGLTRILQNRQLRVRRTIGGLRLVDQLRDFPLGDHDDGPDALEMGVRLTRQLLAA